MSLHDIDESIDPIDDVYYRSFIVSNVEELLDIYEGLVQNVITSNVIQENRQIQFIREFGQILIAKRSILVNINIFNKVEDRVKHEDPEYIDNFGESNVKFIKSLEQWRGAILNLLDWYRPHKQPRSVIYLIQIFNSIDSVSHEKIKCGFPEVIDWTVYTNEIFKELYMYPHMILFFMKYFNLLIYPRMITYEDNKTYVVINDPRQYRGSFFDTNNDLNEEDASDEFNGWSLDGSIGYKVDSRSVWRRKLESEHPIHIGFRSYEPLAIPSNKTAPSKIKTETIPSSLMGPANRSGYKGLRTRSSYSLSTIRRKRKELIPEPTTTVPTLHPTPGLSPNKPSFQTLKPAPRYRSCIDIFEKSELFENCDNQLSAQFDEQNIRSEHNRLMILDIITNVIDESVSICLLTKRFRTRTPPTEIINITKNEINSEDGDSDDGDSEDGDSEKDKSTAFIHNDEVMSGKETSEGTHSMSEGTDTTVNSVYKYEMSTSEENRDRSMSEGTDKSGGSREQEIVETEKLIEQLAMVKVEHRMEKENKLGLPPMPIGESPKPKRAGAKALILLGLPEMPKNGKK